MIRQLHALLPYLELWLSFPGLVMNCYFAWAFSSISMYNANFRILLITLNLITSAVSMIHPLFQILPEQLHSTENGVTPSTVILYFLLYLQNVGIFVLDVKFLLMGLERRVAFKFRDTYEHNHGGVMKWGLMLLITASAILAAVKAAYLFISSQGSVDAALQDAFVLERSLAVFVFSNTLAGASWCYGYWETLRLKKSVLQHQYSAQTLSESFEIKQTGEVVQLVEYMLRMFILCVVLCGSCTAIAIVLRVYGEIPTGSYQMHFVTNLEYVIVGFYNLYSSLLMIFYFKPLKRRLVKDLTSFLPFLSLARLGSPRNSVVAPRADNIETDVYFQTLQRMWNRPQINTSKPES
ncbi:unnamed protein product [Bursaphelenchus xylophilus]|nr:unnamed protein product [Bursaphelenchus xylophilus]CAG9126432.1 unnamed protein product [Bursaphelenchus xylophilus]